MKDVNSIYEQIAALKEKENFFEEMKATGTNEEAAKVFARYGIEVNAEELQEIIDAAREAVEKEGYVKDGELTEKGLDLVAGGLSVKKRTYLYYAVEAAGCAALIAGGPATLCAAALFGGGAAALISLR